MIEADPDKHAESAKKYPNLHLSDGEFVIAEVKRHPIGLFSIWLIDLLVVAFIIAVSIFLASHASDFASTGIGLTPDLVLLGLALVTVLVLLLGYVGQIIYVDNRFYVTNESVIQHIRTGLFTSREQTISLAGIEDASYRQEGFFAYILGYGTIRLSTVGDENTYRFNLVANPKTQLQTLNDAVEEFKLKHVYEAQTAPQPSAPKPSSNDSNN